MTRQNKQNYMKALRVGVGKIPIGMIEEHHARTLFKTISRLRGVKTGKEIVGLLRHMMSVAKEHGIVKENPLLGMRIKGNAPR